MWALSCFHWPCPDVALTYQCSLWTTALVLLLILTWHLVSPALSWCFPIAYINSSHVPNLVLSQTLLHAELFGTDLREEAKLSHIEFSSFTYLYQSQSFSCCPSPFNISSLVFRGAVVSSQCQMLCLVMSVTMSPDQNASAIYLLWLE